MTNFVLVKIAPLGKSVTEVTVEEGTSIRNAIAAAAASGRTTVTGYEDLRRNGLPAKLDDAVKNGDIITLVPAIKGGKTDVTIKKGKRVYPNPFE